MVAARKDRSPPGVQISTNLFTDAPRQIHYILRAARDDIDGQTAQSARDKKASAIHADLSKINNRLTIPWQYMSLRRRNWSWALGEELEQAYGSSYIRGQEDAVLAVPHSCYGPRHFSFSATW
jgi:hypothetical protein